MSRLCLAFINCYINWFIIDLLNFRLSFADGLQYCSDISQSHAPVHELLDEDYGKQRAALIDQNKAADFFLPGSEILYNK